MVSTDANTFVEQGRSRFGWAWVALCLALAVHVFDEALTDFLSIYNPAARSIRERLPFLPIPTFGFRTWLIGLIFAILVMASISSLAFKESWWVGWAAYLFGTVMLVNGLGHILGSFLLGRLMPGVYSAPLVIVCSVYLLVAARGLTKKREERQ